MPNFTLRVQLLGDPDQSAYDDLHSRLKKGGFLRTVVGIGDDNKAVTVDLPHGTYYGASDTTCIAIRKWAKSHAEEAWGDSVVFVAETSTWSLD